MTGFRKRLAAALLVVPLAAQAQGGPPVDRAARLDGLLAELAEPDRDDWAEIESEIVRLWSQSGSPAMDLLLRRGAEATEAQDFDRAVEHLSALVDHAPDFAEGWNARATAFFYLDEYSLSLADIERTLALNPRHFGALEGLAAILDETGRPDLALKAARAAQEINPNRTSIRETVSRLERETGAADL